MYKFAVGLSDSSGGLGGLRRIGDQLEKSTTLSRLTSALGSRDF